VYKDWQCSNVIEKFTQVYECNFVVWNDTNQFVVDLKSLAMALVIDITLFNVKIVLGSFWEIFPSDIKFANIESSFQSLCSRN